MMNARLIKIWQDLQSSYYFIPTLMAIGAIVLAYLTTYIDQNTDPELIKELGWFYSNKADGARSILSTIAGSMITVAGVTFSMTMVAVSSAAAQYGPRLIGNFMRDRANQYTLGTFTSTFIYCLLILRVVRTGDSSGIENAVTEFVPHFSLLTALVLTLASVAVLIYFIHHIPETLNVGNITARVGRELHSEIDELFPSSVGKEDESDSSINYEEKLTIEKSLEVKSDTQGYLQAIDQKTLLSIAIRIDCIIHLQYRPGDFVVKQDILMNIWTENSLDEALTAELLSCFAMGKERTVHQNILFLADELVEILARALSPGVNDPFTAINCMNWYHTAVRQICHGTPPSPYRFDDKGDLRLIVYPISFSRFVDVLFAQSRPYVAADRNTTMHMIEVLTICAMESKTQEQKDILIQHLDDLYKTADEVLSSSIDKRDVTQRYKNAQKMLSDEKYYHSQRNSQTWVGGRA